MNRHSPEFLALIDRIAAGELTRNEAAAEAGIGLGTLNVWISRSKLNARLEPVARNKGPNHPFATNTPERTELYERAVAEGVAGATVRELVERYPTLSKHTLARRVCDARAEARVAAYQAQREAPTTSTPTPAPAQRGQGPENGLGGASKA